MTFYVKNTGDKTINIDNDLLDLPPRYVRMIYWPEILRPGDSGKIVFILEPEFLPTIKEISYRIGIEEEYGGA